MSPETERAVVSLALVRGLVSAAQVNALELESQRARAHGRRVTVRLLVERGALDRATAAALVRHVRESRAASASVAVIDSTIKDLRAPAAPRPVAARPRPAPPAPARGVAVLGPGSELGPYQITGELGRGGMGVVYRALDRRLQREVAIKTISGLADEEATERFVREARAAARLRHPGIVQVLEAGTLSGVSYVALELVAGGSLQKKLEKGAVPPHDAAKLVRDLALAVHAAHLAGIVHRDLKPANVLLDTTGADPSRLGRPRLTDFGLARDDAGASLTETGVALGTPAYMAPEQANADKAAIGARTDVYGLGAVLYHCLTGSAPFQGGGGLAIMHKVITEDVESPSSRRAKSGLPPLARDLETIVQKALEKPVRARYASALELSEDLGHQLAGEAIVARPLGVVERWGRRLRRRGSLAIMGLALLGLLALVGTLVVQGRAAAERQRLKDEALARAQEKARAEARAELERCGADLVAVIQSPLSRGWSSSALPSRLRFKDAGTRVLVVSQRPELADEKKRRGELALTAFNEALRLDDLPLAELAMKEIERSRPDGRAFQARLAEAEAHEDTRLRALAEALRGADMVESLRSDIRGRETLLRAAALDPRCVVAYNALILVEGRNGNFPAALAAADHVVEIDPRWPDNWAARANFRLGRRDRANPGVGSWAAREGDMAAAEADVAKALELDPHCYMALRTQLVILLEKAEWPSLARRAHELQAEFPLDDELYATEANALQRCGRAAESVVCAEKARDLEPAHPAYHGILGGAYAAANRLGDARREFERVIELAPEGSPDAASARHFLAELDRH